MQSIRERFALLLKPGPISPKERRRQARGFYVLLYADGAVLFVLIILFSKEWFIVTPVWYVITLTLLLCMSFTRRRYAREQGIATPLEQQGIARKELAVRLKRPFLLLTASGVLLLFTGRFNPIGYVFSGAVLLVALWLYVLMRRMRQ